MTIKEFSALYNRWRASKRPNVPLHAQPQKSFSDKSANDLTMAIICFFEMKEIKAMRQSSEGRYLPGSTVTNVIGQRITQKGTWIPRSKAGVGQGDIRVVLPPYGRTLEIEVKFGKDRPSEQQKRYRQQLEQMGGIYFIVKTWDDFDFQIQPLLK